MRPEMQLGVFDWAIVGGFSSTSSSGSPARASRAGARASFFLSGRNVPWWLAGTSMVATTFGADTPLRGHGHGRAERIAGTGSGGARSRAACSPSSSSLPSGGAPA